MVVDKHILFETLAVHRAKVQNAAYHNRRFLCGQRFLGRQLPLVAVQQLICPPDDGFWRGKIVYSKHTLDITYSPHRPKIIRRFGLVFDDAIDYRYKYHDRRALTQLLTQAQAACPAIDEVIIVKHGLISDCTIGNLLFFDGQRWLTPTSFLLNGTQRQYLLDSGTIGQAVITLEDLPKFCHIMMVNALNPFDLARALPIEAIVWRGRR